MNTRRRIVLAAGAAALAFPHFARAEQGRVWRVGILAARPRAKSPEVDAYSGFVQGMSELGYVEGKNLAIEWRFAEGRYDRLPALAAELVKLKVDVIVTAGTAANTAAQKATAAIPIVGATMMNPVGNRFATSLAHPGQNITGLSLTTGDVTPKLLELLKILMPKLSRVAVLTNPRNPGHGEIIAGLQGPAQQLGLKIQAGEASTPEEIDAAFEKMTRDRAEALVIVLDAFFIGQRKQIGDLALKNRLPSISSAREHVDAGSLMSYGQNLVEFYRRAATYVDKIIKGAKPGELPIEQVATFSLTINGKTAKALGLTIPPELMLRADKVIE